MSILVLEHPGYKNSVKCVLDDANPGTTSFVSYGEPVLYLGNERMESYGNAQVRLYDGTFDTNLCFKHNSRRVHGRYEYGMIVQLHGNLLSAILSSGVTDAIYSVAGISYSYIPIATMNQLTHALNGSNEHDVNINITRILNLLFNLKINECSDKFYLGNVLNSLIGNSNAGQDDIHYVASFFKALGDGLFYKFTAADSKNFIESCNCGTYVTRSETVSMLERAGLIFKIKEGSLNNGESSFSDYGISPIGKLVLFNYTHASSAINKKTYS